MQLLWAHLSRGGRGVWGGGLRLQMVGVHKSRGRGSARAVPLLQGGGSKAYAAVFSHA